ncbi:hypothetical protein ACWIUH_06945 [Ursidibacter arcticus]
MFSQVARLCITPSFNKAMSIALMIGVLINAFLCYERKVLQAQNQAQHTEIALVRSDNQNLANQLELAQSHIQQYQQQIEKLHQQVLAKLNQAEERTNEIIQELDNVKNWRDQPIPNGIGRLLNQRSGTLSNHQTAPTGLPTQPTVPNAQVSAKK